MSSGIIRIEDDRLVNQIHREVMPADLVGDEAEEMHGAGMVGLRGEDLTVEGLGFGQSPGAVALEGQIESFRERHGRVGGRPGWMKGKR